MVEPRARLVIGAICNLCALLLLRVGGVVLESALVCNAHASTASSMH